MLSREITYRRTSGPQLFFRTFSATVQIEGTTTNNRLTCQTLTNESSCNVWTSLQISGLAATQEATKHTSRPLCQSAIESAAGNAANWTAETKPFLGRLSVQKHVGNAPMNQQIGGFNP
jgi:hypothetical protein